MRRKSNRAGFRLILPLMPQVVSARCTGLTPGSVDLPPGDGRGRGASSLRCLSLLSSDRSAFLSHASSAAVGVFMPSMCASAHTARHPSNVGDDVTVPPAHFIESDADMFDAMDECADWAQTQEWKCSSK